MLSPKKEMVIKFILRCLKLFCAPLTMSNILKCIFIFVTLVTLSLAAIPIDAQTCIKAAQQAAAYSSNNSECFCPYKPFGTSCDCGGGGGFDCSGLIQRSFNDGTCESLNNYPQIY